MRVERQWPGAIHTDPVRRVESGHVLVLESYDLEHFVGELANARAEGWELVSVNAVAWVPQVQMRYVATHVRGVVSAPMGMEMAGGVGNE